MSTILLNSCDFDKTGEWDIYELYAQKIEGSSRILYKYDDWEEEAHIIWIYINRLYKVI